MGSIIAVKRICPDCDEPLEEYEEGPRCNICWNIEMDALNEIDDVYDWDDDE